jgi:primosomal replication protein N
MKRKVECEINAVALGDLALKNLKIGDRIQVTGFLAKRSLKSTQLVMHINHIETV